MTRNGTEVSWDDIAGLEGPKELFKQTIVLPALMPNFFKAFSFHPTFFSELYKCSCFREFGVLGEEFAW